MFAIIKNDPSEVKLTSADVVGLAAGTNNIGDVDVLTIAAGDNNIGNVDVVTLPALVAGTANIGDVDVLTIAAGDNNIGNVDIVTLPAGNLGMQAMAASQSVVPASDITDATYIGDIKFGESLPAGTAAIGKLVTNSGVDIGDVDILSIAAGDNNIGNVDIVTLPALVAGTANIGDVDVLTIAAGDNNIGNVDIASAIPAGTNLIGAISASCETSIVYNGTTALTPKFAAIDAASSGDNTIVAAVASKKIRVLSVFLVASAAVTTRFESGAAGTALTGQMQLGANGGFVLPFNPTGWFETASAVLLNLELSGAISVDGSLVYIEV